MDMYEHNFSTLINKVIQQMEEKKCRLYSDDIINALRKTTFNYNSIDGFYNITVDTSTLIKHNQKGYLSC